MTGSNMPLINREHCGNVLLIDSKHSGNELLIDKKLAKLEDDAECVSLPKLTELEGDAKCASLSEAHRIGEKTFQLN